MQSGRGPYTDITGVSLEQFTKKTGVRVKVLHKIDTRFANQQLYRNGSLQNYVEQYLTHPLTQAYEALPRLPSCVRNFLPCRFASFPLAKKIDSGQHAASNFLKEPMPEQRRLQFYQADVFTDEPFGGNPVAVFPMPKD